MVVDQSSDAASEDHKLEVDQQADTDIQQTKVREQLSVINRVQRVFAFWSRLRLCRLPPGLLESRNRVLCFRR